MWSQLVGGSIVIEHSFYLWLQSYFSKGQRIKEPKNSVFVLTSHLPEINLMAMPDCEGG